MLSCYIPHRKSRHLCSISWRSILSHPVSAFYHFRSILSHPVSAFYRFRSILSHPVLAFYHVFYNFLFHLNPFLIELFYFTFISFVGFGVLKALKPRTIMPGDLNLFFMSVSSATVSSMSTVDMEVFSNAQLIVMAILMLIGGDVFLSMVGLYLSTYYSQNPSKIQVEVVDSHNKITPEDLNHVEMGIVGNGLELEESHNQHKPAMDEAQTLKYNSLKLLILLILAYLVVIHFSGVVLVLVYMRVVASAREVLERKGLKIITYAVFTVVSSFSSCGFTPTNENMAIFSNNSGLLIIILPQLLLGNTLYPSCLRFLIWLCRKFLRKNEFEYLLKSDVNKIRYSHLLPSIQSRLLALTVFGFIGVQMVLFCAMEWNSGLMSGMNGYQKFVGSLFQVTSTRHTGETIINLAATAPAVLVLFVVMMYLPPYTTFLPPQYNEDHAPQVDYGNQIPLRQRIMENVLFSQLGYLVIFVIAICITERRSMVEDPLNFNVLNIIVEVVSAYGNVGYSIGYSCELRLHPQGSCTDEYYGFAGKWSNQGKIILIVVMFFGRLKKFNMQGGKAWKIA